MILTVSVTANTQIYLKVGQGNGAVQVNWGDGSPLVTTNVWNIAYIYPTSGTYTLYIYVSTTGFISEIGQGYNANGRPLPLNNCLTAINDWGDFGGLQYLWSIGGPLLTTVPNYLPSSVVDLTFFFYRCTSLQSDISQWNVGGVSNFYIMFGEMGVLTQDISRWNVSNLASMSWIFYGTAFNQDISQWAINGCDLTDARAYYLNQNLAGWNIATSGLSMFSPGLDILNTTLTLIGWAALPNLQTGAQVSFGSGQYYTAASAAYNYLVGTKGWVLNLTSVNTPLLAVQYNASTTRVYILGEQIVPYKPALIGTYTTVLFTVSPALPAGLSLNSSTGIISGIPTAISPAISYVITTSADNGALVINTTLNFTVIPVIYYDNSFNSLINNLTPIPTLQPITSSLFNINSYLVSPTLPSGITINVSTGVITGTPTEAALEDQYTISAALQANASLLTSATSRITLSVSDISYANLSYTTLDMFASYTITPLSCVISGGSVIELDLNALPDLSFNTTTGVISGVPMQEVASNTYPLTLTTPNAQYQKTLNFTFRVNGGWRSPMILDLSGVPGGFLVSLPLDGITGNYEVVWGDGQLTLNSLIHTYAVGGNYTIKIYVATAGSITDFGTNVNNWTGSAYLTAIREWGDFSNLQNLFKIGGAQLVSVPSTIPGTVRYMYFMFYNCTNFNQDISGWNVGQVLNMESMFENCTNFNRPLNNWTVSNVTNMRRMFIFSTSFNQPLNSWNVGQVTNMSFMFYNCTNFNQPLNSWNVSNVTNMAQMFQNCTNFNQPLNNWNVSNVTNMSYMFSGCTNFNSTIDSWNVSNVTTMSNMFNECTNFNNTIGKWIISSTLLNMSGMFTACTNFNEDISNWQVNTVQNMSYMFTSCKNFNQNISRWNVSNVTNMAGMFADATSFNQPIGSWNVAQVTDMNQMFFCSSLIINAAFNQDITGWNVGAVTNMREMFFFNKNFNQDLSSWNVSNVTDMYYMFYGTKMNQNLGRWNVSNVTTMSNMFFIDAWFDTLNCTATLLGWASLPSLQTNVPFYLSNNFLGHYYYAAATSAYNRLTSTYGWIDQATMTSITDPPLAVEYNQLTSRIYGRTVVILPYTPSLLSTYNDVVFSVAPPLPTGLSIDSSGSITGTPTVLSSPTDYIVTTTANSGALVIDSSLNFSVIPVFVYDPSFSVALKNVPINLMYPIVANGYNIQSYNPPPTFVDGLDLNLYSGYITGTPTTAQGQTSYTILGLSTGYNTSTDINITVADISYQYQSYSFLADVSVNIQPTVFQLYGTTISLNLSELPGLTFDPVTGDISGTPLYDISQNTYNLIATTPSNFTKTIPFLLSVSDISYTTLSYVFLVGVPVNIVPTKWALYNQVYANFLTSLPSGLYFDNIRGTITGTPQSTSNQTQYTLELKSNVPFAPYQTKLVDFYFGVDDIEYAVFDYGFLANVPLLGPISPTVLNLFGGTTLQLDLSALPGLTFDPVTGDINGKPLRDVSTNTYNLIATTPSNSIKTLPFSFAVSDISYNPIDLSYVFLGEVPIRPITPTLFSLYKAAYVTMNSINTINLDLEASTGIISGTPQYSTTVGYALTLTGQSYSKSINFYFTVDDISYVNLNYGFVANVPLHNNAITPSSLHMSGGTTLQLDLAALPGLTFDNSTGNITGTPLQDISANIYNLTATAPPPGNYQKIIPFTISVSDISYNPVDLSYVFLQGVPIRPIIPTYCRLYNGANIGINGLYNTLNLNIDDTTGVISGTPVFSTTSYPQGYSLILSTTIPYGSYSKSITFYFTVDVIEYPQLEYGFLSDVVIEPVIPTDIKSFGGMTLQLDLSALTGLTFDSTSGDITGTPIQYISTNTYTLTATTPSNYSKTIPFSFTVADLSYSTIDLSYVFLYQIDIRPITPSINALYNGAAYTYFQDNLPNGLLLNQLSGVISGTPFQGIDANTYDLVVYTQAQGVNPSYTKIIRFNFTVAAVQYFGFLTSTFLANISIGNNFPSNYFYQPFGGTVVTFDALPSGLSFNNLGRLEGTPLVNSPPTTYTLTATTPYPGNYSVSYPMFLTVTDISYTDLSYVFLAGIDVSNITPTVNAIYDGAAALSFEYLPYDLSFNTLTGVISGAPSYNNTEYFSPLTIRVPGVSVIWYGINVQTANTTIFNGYFSVNTTTNVIQHFYYLNPSGDYEDILLSQLGDSGSDNIFTNNDFTLGGTNLRSVIPYFNSLFNPPPYKIQFYKNGGFSYCQDDTYNSPNWIDLGPSYLSSTFSPSIFTTNVYSKILNFRFRTDSINYTDLSYVFLANAPISSIVPSIPFDLFGGTTLQLDLTGLPNLTFDPSLGRITGTAVNATPPAYYTLTATTPSNYTKIIPFYFTVADISYNTEPNYIFLADVSINPIIPIRTPYGAITTTMNLGLLPHLQCDISSGVISGMPTLDFPQQNYTLTATTSGGCTKTFIFSFTIADIRYFNLSYVFMANSIITDIIPSFKQLYGGTTTLNLSGIPGLAFNSSTATISGTPLQATPPANYTLTAFTPGNEYSKPLIFNLTVADISYNTDISYVFLADVSINPISPSFRTSYGAITTVLDGTLLPSLVCGLNTGIISGVPLQATLPSIYSLTATTSGGSVKIFYFSFTVADIYYSDLSYVFMAGTNVNNITPAFINLYGGSTVMDLSGIPNLICSTTTGVISGTPINATPPANYTLTASTAGNEYSKPLIFNLAVVDISYTDISYVFLSDVAINPIYPLYQTDYGNKITYSIDLAGLPSLACGSTTGIISGTPVKAAAPSIYPLTATTDSGYSKTIPLSFTVADISYTDLSFVFMETVNIGLIGPSLSALYEGTTVQLDLTDLYGLTFHPTSGNITGIPLFDRPEAIYPLTIATTTGYSKTLPFYLTVADIRYAESSYVFITDVDVSNITPSQNALYGGSTVSMNWQTLTGLSVNPSTGVISGAPLKDTSPNTYQLTATTLSNYSKSIPFRFAVSDISYTDLSYVFLTDISINKITPSLRALYGGTTLQLDLSGLPELTFFPATGDISGTPLRATPTATYPLTITTPSRYSKSLPFRLTVADISYTDLSYVFLAGVDVSNITPSVPALYAGTTVALDLSTLGLVCNPATGVISGTPPRDMVEDSYTLTVSTAGQGGTIYRKSMTFDLTVADISYSDLSYVFLADISINKITPSRRALYGGTTVQMDLSGIPGLTFFPATGDISGTPLRATPTATYPLTVSTPSRYQKSLPFRLTVADISYTDLSYLFLAGVDVNNITPSLQALYAGTTVALDLSTLGLVCNPATGVISGTPPQDMAEDSYTLTVSTTGLGGTIYRKSMTFDLTVADISYSDLSYVFLADISINKITPSRRALYGGTTVQMDLSGIPGLTFFPATGDISGTPIRAAPTATYPLTVSTPGNIYRKNLPFRFTVADISYTDLSYVFLAGVDVNNITPSVSALYAGTTVNLDLSTLGLVCNPASGVISGTPPQDMVEDSYTLTVNTAGQGGTIYRKSMTFDLTVADISYSDLSYVFLADISINKITPSRRALYGGTTVQMDLSGIPGLTFFPATGDISGTPIRAATTATYPLTVRTPSRYQKAIPFQLTVADISYTDLSFVFLAGVPVALQPTSKNLTQTTLTINPSFTTPQNGITFDPLTGNFGGQPITSAPATPYTLTADTLFHGHRYQKNVPISFTVTDINYDALNYVYLQNNEFLHLPLDVSGLNIIPTIYNSAFFQSLTFNPALPRNLNISLADGVIRGTPTVAAYPTNYTLQARTVSGYTKDVNLNIQVEGFNYSETVYTFNYSDSINVPIVLNTGQGSSTYTNFRVSPPLSSGLSLNPITGAITGVITTMIESLPLTTVYYITGYTANTITNQLVIVLIDPNAKVCKFTCPPAVIFPREISTINTRAMRFAALARIGLGQTVFVSNSGETNNQTYQEPARNRF
jgi:surface protein